MASKSSLELVVNGTPFNAEKMVLISRAFSSDIRSEILALLAENPKGLGVSQIIEQIQEYSESTISRNITEFLEKADLVASRRDRQRKIKSLNPDYLVEYAGFLSSLSSLSQEPISKVVLAKREGRRITLGDSEGESFYPINFDEIAKIGKALDNGNRLNILAILQQGHVHESSLVYQLSVSQPTINRHIRTLALSGLIKHKKGPGNTLYFNPDALTNYEAFVRYLASR